MPHVCSKELQFGGTRNDRDRYENDKALHDALDVCVHADKVEAVIDDTDKECAEECARNRGCAWTEHRHADEHRGKSVKQIAFARIWLP